MGAFGRILRFLRETNELTLRQLQNEVNIDNAYLSQLETGTVTNPSVLTVAKLARYYKLKTLWRLVEAIEEDNATTSGGQKEGE